MELNTILNFQKDGSDNILKFNFYIKHLSDIKCNKIKLEYTLIDIVDPTLIDSPNPIYSELITGNIYDVQHNYIFGINIGPTKLKRINYTITPIPNYKGIDISKFIISDSLDLSKDKLTWLLSPHWEENLDFEICEEDISNPGFSTGFSIIEVIGRYGTILGKNRTIRFR